MSAENLIEAAGDFLGSDGKYQPFADEILRDVFDRAARITSMLQGTMALEGQALDLETLREMTRMTARELMGFPPAPNFTDGGVNRDGD